MRVKILGSAAGGGFPQWNCACPNCRRLRDGSFPGRARTQTQAAISSDAGVWHLLNASPDLRTQLSATRELWPQRGTRSTPIASVILTSADVDSVLGLLHLREFQPFRIYCTSGVRRILREENSIFRVLDRAMPPVEWIDLPLGERVSIEPSASRIPGPNLRVMACGSAGAYPDYVSVSLRAELPPREAVIGLAIEENQKRLFHAPTFAPGEQEWRLQVRGSAMAFLDGTFWSDDELIRLRGSGPTARQMGHLPFSGDAGLLEHLADAGKCRRVLIHINNTNPILDEESAEHRAVLDAGWEIAYDGMEISM